MRAFAALYDALDRTTSTNAKVAAMRAYFATAPAADAAWAVYFLTGRRLKRLLSYVSIRDWTLAATGLPSWLLDECYAAVGDGAETSALVLDQLPSVPAPDLPLAEWVERRILTLRELEGAGQRRRSLAGGAASTGCSATSC
jgi:DNA ligase-1